MSARHFKTAESSTTNWYEQPEQPEERAEEQPKEQPSAADQTDSGAKTIPMKEPYPELFDEPAAPAAPVPLAGSTDPAFERISAPIAGASPATTGAVQSAQQDYTPEFDFEERHNGVRFLVIFIVVFALFFGGAFVYLHFFAR